MDMTADVKVKYDQINSKPKFYLKNFNSPGKKILIIISYFE